MANAVRALSMDAVQKAESGHPGLPMGAADIAAVLFSEILKIDVSHPEWPDRDRFVLSAGHGSMLLYSCLHLLGYKDMPMSELEQFRQLGAVTAGHPEYGEVAGIETTTGPLGQGLGNAVGMAIAEAHLRARFGEDLVNHRTYVLAGDGCLMEGISHEAISLAGHLKLNKLIVLFDDNNVSIDGTLDLAESGDQQRRFQAAGWSVDEVDGHDPDAIRKAILAAHDSERPTMIACKTTIGYGAPNKQGTAGVHGAPLGHEEVAAARTELDWEHAPFKIPTEVCDDWRVAGVRGCRQHAAWQKRLGALDPELRGEFERRIRGDLPADLPRAIQDLKAKLAKEKPSMATRKASQTVLEVINPVVPETIGGSADLTGSNNTLTSDLGIMTADDFSGRYIHYGVREHGMAAVMNGLALHGGIIPYGGTFLVFSDYCRPSIRLSALMGKRVIYVMTHDSIGLGEDGPTHQPVEHLASLRAMPNLLVLRPADVTETAECWELALEKHDGPSLIALTRQGLPPVRTEFVEDNLCARGAYELAAAEGGDAAVSIFASGSEVEIAVEARSLLQGDGTPTRVVSVPSFEKFDQQEAGYRESVIGSAPVRIAVEAGVNQGWMRFIGETGTFVGMSTFGASAPHTELYEHFGITAQALVNAARLKLGT